MGKANETHEKQYYKKFISLLLLRIILCVNKKVWTFEYIDIQKRKFDYWNIYFMLTI